MNLQELANRIEQRFNANELRDLFFKLNIDYDNLPGSTHKDKVRELVKFCNRHGKLDELISLCTALRPNETWNFENQNSNKRTIEQSSNNPLSIKSILSGVIITVISGVILAFLIQDARFDPARDSIQTPSNDEGLTQATNVLSTPTPINPSEPTITATSISIVSTNSTPVPASPIPTDIPSPTEPPSTIAPDDKEEVSSRLRLEEFQTIFTRGAQDFEAFSIEGNHYLAVANIGDYGSVWNVESKIYKWDGEFFVEYQPIPTLGAVDWEFFTIDNDYYLVVANQRNDPKRNLDSIIYRWDGARFVEYQSINTSGAADWEFFTIGEYHYLAVANFINNSIKYEIDSKIYRWDGAHFNEFQSISTIGGRDWEFFTIDGNHYLALANYRASSTYNVESKVYQWNGTNFVEFQSILTNTASQWKYFAIDGEHYLAISNTGNGSTANVDSKIYRWNGINFIEFQRIPTQGGLGWEPFKVDDAHFLAVSNYTTGSDTNINSEVYQWDGVKFIEFQSIYTKGGRDWEFFTIDENHYLAIANMHDSANYSTESKIYRFVSRP